MLSVKKMSENLVPQPVTRRTLGRKNSKESIHSGHFMVSDFEAEAQDEEGLEVPDQNGTPQPVHQIKGIQSIKQGDVITYAKPTNSRNDKTIVSIDASLTKLFTTMSIAYRQNITSPKWNRFKGLKLSWKDKIRLNNVIWRCWHMQFILKKKMTVCPFALDVDIHTKPETTLLEGKYWKRRIEAVTAEYKKWRLFYKNRQAGILMSCETGDQSFLGLEEMEWARSFLGNEGELAELDFMDVLLASPQQFHFPNVREIARGTENSDLLQPGLMQLQPCFNDDFVDFHEMLARDLPTVPEEDLFPDVQTPPSPISTPTPNLQYTARLTTGYDPVFPPDNSAAARYDGNAFAKIAPRSPSRATGDSRPERARAIARSRSQQELNSPRSVSPLRPDLTPFAVPKPYTRRRSHSGSVGHFGSSSDIRLANVLNTLSVPSLPAALTSSSATSDVFLRGTANADPTLSQNPQNSGLLAQLLTPHDETPVSCANKFKLSLFLPPSTLESVPMSVSSSSSSLMSSNSSSNSISSAAGVCSKAIVSPLYPHAGMTSVTLSAVTPSSIKTAAFAKQASSWSSPQSAAINLKTSPPHPIPSPPLASPQNKPFRPKNDVERVQYREHRRKCHISAEQKRRCNIKNNFEHMHSLIPSVSHNPNSKVSKATMLHKGAEYIQQLKIERQQLSEKADNLRREIEKLGGDISTAQSLLPATGAPLSHSRHSKLKEKFDHYVRDRTLEHWKFYVFSLVAEPLLDSFSTSVSTCSVDDLCRSSLAWLDQHCSLNVLRPVVSNSMRKLSTTTSILSAPEFLAEETTRFVTKQETSQSTTKR